MTLPVQDPLTNATTVPISTYNAHWTTLDAGLQVSSGGCIPNVTGVYQEALWNADTFPADQYAQALWDTGGGANGIAVALRMSGAAGSFNGYYLLITGNNQMQVRKCVAGVHSGVSGILTPAVNFATNDVFRLAVVGTQIVAYKNAAQVWSGTDSDIASGAAGVAGSDLGTVRCKAWNAGRAPPFSAGVGQTGAAWGTVVAGAIQGNSGNASYYKLGYAGTPGQVDTAWFWFGPFTNSSNNSVKVCLYDAGGNLVAVSAVIPKIVSTLCPGAITPVTLTSQQYTIYVVPDTGYFVPMTLSGSSAFQLNQVHAANFPFATPPAVAPAPDVSSAGQEMIVFFTGAPAGGTAVDPGVLSDSHRGVGYFGPTQGFGQLFRHAVSRHYARTPSGLYVPA
jgi:hypothetical protein